MRQLPPPNTCPNSRIAFGSSLISCVPSKAYLVSVGHSIESVRNSQFRTSASSEGDALSWPQARRIVMELHLGCVYVLVGVRSVQEDAKVRPGSTPAGSETGLAQTRISHMTQICRERPGGFVSLFSVQRYHGEEHAECDC